ncbi:MAG: tape measure protein, partial [Bacteroides sp.]
AKTEAAMGETAAKSTAAYAKFPFVGVGLAAAAIAAMFALIPKFKDGGIVAGGPTSGDKILARVNAGEMILNQGQQSNLWKMLNNKSSVSGQSVNIGGRVRGSDIYLSLKNYMKSSGKKL